MGKFLPLKVSFRHLEWLLLHKIEGILAALGLDVLVEVFSDACHKLTDLI